MHRGFFAQALEDNPVDPLGSRYSQSVLAAYSSACTFIGLIESLFKQQPVLTERMWFLFTHVFSCSVSRSSPKFFFSYVVDVKFKLSGRSCWDQWRSRRKCSWLLQHCRISSRRIICLVAFLIILGRLKSWYVALARFF